MNELPTECKAEQNYQHFKIKLETFLGVGGKSVCVLYVLLF